MAFEGQESSIFNNLDVAKKQMKFGYSNSDNLLLVDVGDWKKFRFKKNIIKSIRRDKNS